VVFFPKRKEGEKNPTYSKKKIPLPPRKERGKKKKTQLNSPSRKKRKRGWALSTLEGINQLLKTDLTEGTLGVAWKKY